MGESSKQKAPGQKTPGQAVCILGMHRSGTSSLARVLNLLGVDLGRHLMKPGEDNPKGFWEHAHLVFCHVELLAAIGSYYDDIIPLPDGWEKKAEVKPFRDRLIALLKTEFANKPLWGFKDPRACRLVALWHDIFTELNVRPGYIIVLRPPHEVAASMYSREGHGYNQSLLMSLGHMLESERQTRGRPRVMIEFEHVLADWRGAVERIGSGLGIKWPASPDAMAGQVNQFLDPSLRHHIATEVNSAESAVSVGKADPRIARWVFGVYQVLAAAAADEKSRVDHAALDHIRAEFLAASPELAAWRTKRSQKEKYVRIQLMAARLDEEVMRLNKENAELRQAASRWQAVIAAQARLEAARDQADAKIAGQPDRTNWSSLSA